MLHRVRDTSLILTGSFRVRLQGAAQRAASRRMKIKPLKHLASWFEARCRKRVHARL
ncbi:MAG: hypothetical protein OJF62_001703 [Pseudolabrys sp.]|nr:hypothetical protein [Pseudolabrys sp.]